MRKHDNTINEIIKVNDSLKLRFKTTHPNVKFKESTTLEMAKDIVLSQSSEKSKVYDEIEQVFEREAPIETERHADMVLGEIARLFWK